MNGWIAGIMETVPSVPIPQYKGVFPVMNVFTAGVMKPVSLVSILKHTGG